MTHDDKDIFKSKDKEEAFEKRYGKKVSIDAFYDVENEPIKSFDELKAYRLKFRSGNNEYEIDEHLKGGATDYVILRYNKNGKKIENRFNRFLDAEVSLADKISEES